MKAWQFNAGTNQWREADLPTPLPGDGEVLVRVAAAGVTPSELLWSPTSHTQTGGTREWAVPGHEFAGTIEALGRNATGFNLGDAIYGMSDWFADGALAEFCITRPEWIAPRPKSLSPVEAAAVPIGALTAWQGLFVRAKVKPGERILVQGGSGSVGSFVVQLARGSGAIVVATASASNVAWLKELGAHVAVDYRQPDAMPREPFDVIFDTVGGETLARSWELLRPGGRMVSIAADQEGSTDERSKAAFFVVDFNAEQLRRVGEYFDRSELKITVGPIVPFNDASAAYRPASKSGGRGKAVVQVAS